MQTSKTILMEKNHRLNYVKSYKKAATPQLQREVIEQLERAQTNLVIYKTGSRFDAIDKIPNEERLPLVAEYLQRHYERATSINGTVLLRRKRNLLEQSR